MEKHIQSLEESATIAKEYLFIEKSTSENIIIPAANYRSAVEQLEKSLEDNSVAHGDWRFDSILVKIKYGK